MTNQATLSRRSLLKWTAALGGTAMLAEGGLHFGLKKAEAAPQAAPAADKWVAAACWHNCGGRCLIKANVVGGVITRVKTDDNHPDSVEYPQQRGCQRGRAQRGQIMGADRLKYPMKRAHWAPGGGDKSLRGKDTWVRISWDEALDIVASETKRISAKYGFNSIYALGSEIPAAAARESLDRAAIARALDEQCPTQPHARDATDARRSGRAPRSPRPQPPGGPLRSQGMRACASPDLRSQRGRRSP